MGGTHIITARIGQGGMGSVYEALNRTLVGQRVALETLGVPLLPSCRLSP